MQTHQKLVLDNEWFQLNINSKLDKPKNDFQIYSGALPNQKSLKDKFKDVKNPKDELEKEKTRNIRHMILYLIIKMKKL